MAASPIDNSSHSVATSSERERERERQRKRSSRERESALAGDRNACWPHHTRALGLLALGLLSSPGREDDRDCAQETSERERFDSLPCKRSGSKAAVPHIVHLHEMELYISSTTSKLAEWLPSKTGRQARARASNPTTSSQHKRASYQCRAVASQLSATHARSGDGGSRATWKTDESPSYGRVSPLIAL